jgi:predicted N-formylglutamate amidohydrolase
VASVSANTTGIQLAYWRAGLYAAVADKGDTGMTYNPVEILGEARTSRWVITCDHARNTVPDAVNGGTLGLPDADMARHIAFDPGAAEIAAGLGEAMNAPVVLSNFSRLVIDPNRGADDPTLLMKLYDGTIIPANRHADADEVMRRRALCYDPYHDALARVAGRQADTVIVSVHSFTPQLRGRNPRPWEVGILYAGDRRVADPLMGLLEKTVATPIGDNEPYKGHLPGDAVDRHGLQAGRANVLLELRQDVIADAQGQAKWVGILAPLLEQALDIAQV